MADALLLTSHFAAAAGFVVLAAGLLAVRISSRVNRVFALYLLLQGAAFLVSAGARLEAGTLLGDVLSRYFSYLVLPLPFVLAYFVVVYLHPQRRRLLRWVAVAALTCAILVDGLYMVNPCLAYCGSPDRLEAGILAPLHNAAPLAQAIVAILLALGSKTQELRAPAMRVVATAFAMLALVEGSLIATIFFTAGLGGFTFGFVPNVWIVLQRSLGLVAFVAAALAFVHLGRTSNSPLRVATTAGLAVVIAVVVNAAGLAPAAGVSVSQLLVGLWRLFAVALVAYALVRHRFLALDATVNFVVRKGPLVTVMFATFFVVFQVIENILDAQMGLVAGGVATGVMLLAVRPLERVGNRMASTVVPRGEPPKAISQKFRVRLFREQAFMVWSDGSMGRKERLLLDNLRERLGIAVDVAARVESEAARQMSPRNHPA